MPLKICRFLNFSKICSQHFLNLELLTYYRHDRCICCDRIYFGCVDRALQLLLQAIELAARLVFH